ncbi:(2Fe-2S)-binding protein [Mycobacterium tuberculosis variant bovis]|nr:(2Fe-2S)-binding protein [Mycobacterium tuberculosis variant bovis]
MYVCLCVGATNQTVSEVVARGATTSKEIAAACGAGATAAGAGARCGRAILAASAKLETAPSGLRPLPRLSWAA